MANNYVITTATRLGNQVTIVGTVNGVSVTIQVDFGWYTSFPSTAALQAALAPLMLAAVPPTAVQLPVSSWSQ